MQCPRCKWGKMARVARHGFLEERILARWGVFPWECSSCRKRFLRRERGGRKRRPAENRSAS
jgi:hypothetical protein